MNFSINDCKFYIDEEKRKIICIIPNTDELALSFIDQFNIGYSYNLKKIKKMLVMPKSFCGIATCHIEDKFDENIGKLIAYNKARRKLNVSLFKRLNSYVQFLDYELGHMINVLNDYGEKQSRRESTREQKIKEYFNEV